MTPELDALRANRAALNRMDEAELIYRGKSIARSAMLFPSLVDYHAIRTAILLLQEALENEPRTAASRQSAA